MKHLLLTTIAAVLVVGCGESQQSAPAPEVKPVEPVAGAKAPDISIHKAARDGKLEAVKQHLAAGADVNAKNIFGGTLLHIAALNGFKEFTELLIAKGGDVNAKDRFGKTPLDSSSLSKQTEVADLLRKHGGKTAEELKAEGK